MLLQCRFFSFCLGSFSWVKLSGIIVAGTIGAALFVVILFKVRKRLQATLVFGLLGSFFWLPFVGLEGLNNKYAGKTADQAYKQIVSSAEAPLTGEHWMESTQGGWLLWSALQLPLGTHCLQKALPWAFEISENNFNVFEIGCLKKKSTIMFF